MQNSHPSEQIDKLKHLCHLCLSVIMTSQQQQQQQNQSSSSSSTSSAMRTVKSDNTLDATAKAIAAKEHIHQHQWFVLPNEAAAVANSDIVNQLNTEVIDLNNIEATFQAIHRLWLAQKDSTTRLLFFYQMFNYLFDKYLNVIHCDCHHPPCAPSVEATLFGKLGVQIVRRLLECINRSRHLVIQIEILTSIESLVYNRTHYRPALSEVFHHLFTAGLIEATAFVEWAKLEDPSAQFEAAQHKQNAAGGQPSKGTSAESQQQLKSKESKTKLKVSLSMPPKLSPTTSGASPSSSAQQTEPQPTNRERLFQELKKAGFAIFKCKF